MFFIKKCDSVGLLIIMLLFALGVGFGISKEVNQKPTPRALTNYGTALYHSGEIEEAILYWDIVINYNKIYGVEKRNKLYLKQARVSKYAAKEQLRTGKVPNFTRGIAR